jgi:hypothetical protein
MSLLERVTRDTRLREDLQSLLKELGNLPAEDPPLTYTGIRHNKRKGGHGTDDEMRDV